MTWQHALRDSVVTMHASNRYPEHDRDYLAERKRQDFTGYISIKDGVDSIDQLHRSIAFLRRWTQLDKVE